MNFEARARAIGDELTAHRHYLHQHAELSFQEHETTAYLIAQMEQLGIEVQSYPDYTGCIATIRGGKPGKTVLLRGDIDALPIQENSGVDYESLNPGIMHACGHDCHATMLLGAAKLLHERRDELCGTVKLLFQAAEEVFIGSRYYVDKGHVADVDAAMAMHVWPSLPEGRISVQDGQVMASCDNFKLTVHGLSAHGSTPQQGRDAIVAASSILCNLQTIVARRNDPLNSLVITVGKIQAGTQFNIICDTAVMEGTVRAHGRETRAMVEQAIREVAENTAATLGCTATLEYEYLEPPVSNDDPALNQLARDAASKLYGPEVLCESVPVMGSEDFSYIMDAVPTSLMAFLGSYNEATGCVHRIHNEKFKVNDTILSVGAAFYAQFAADYLAQHAGGDGK